MGWSFTKNGTKATVVAERLRKSDWTTDATDVGWTGYPAGTRIEHTTIKHAVVADSLWKVVSHKVTGPDGVIIKDGLFIGLDMLEKRDYGWGYKDLSESMGLYDTSCPAEFLDLVPVPDSEYAIEWRATIRKKAAGVPLPLFEGVA